MAVFTARGLSKRYGSGKNTETALSGVDLSLEKGRIYGLVGDNGAGKTTLMRLMAGLVLPSAGTMTLFGASEGKSLREARKKLGTLIAEPAGYEDLSLWQNLRAQAMLLPKTEKTDLRDLCSFVGLEPGALRRSLRQCSTGERQRYGLAAALLGRPELLLLDEPMNGLDPSGVAELRELLLRLRGEGGMTLLVSSHLLEELHKIATDYIFLRYGTVLEAISAQELDRRVEAGGLKNVEEYYLRLNREAREREGSFLWGKEA